MGGRCGGATGRGAGVIAGFAAAGAGRGDATDGATGVDATGVDATGVDATGVDATGVDAAGVDAAGVAVGVDATGGETRGATGAGLVAGAGATRGGAGGLGLGGAGGTVDVLLLGTGIVTAFPLIWFAHGARRLRLATLGALQYVSPSLGMAIAVFVFAEDFGPWHAVAFTIIWVSLAIYGADAAARTRVHGDRPRDLP